VFQDGKAWRVAEVWPDVTITAGGQSLTLEEFSALLRSTDPADAELANGIHGKGGQGRGLLDQGPGGLRPPVPRGGDA
jgi:hypothetical protein